MNKKKKTNLEELANYSLWAKSSLLLSFVNKVLLVHSHAHLCCLWLLPHYSSQHEFTTKTNWPTKFKMLLCGYFLKEFAKYQSRMLTISINLENKDTKLECRRWGLV